MSLWLCFIQHTRVRPISHTHTYVQSPAAMKKEKWVKESQGQMIITSGQIVWTHECEKALADADSARRAVKALKKKWISYLNKLTIITRSKLGKIDRGKVCGSACLWLCECVSVCVCVCAVCKTVCL